MKKQMVLCPMVVLLCATSGVAQTPGKKPNPASSPAALTDIRKVDFLDFTYHPSLCSREYGKEGIGKTVQVRDGEFKSKNVYFEVLGDKVVYADVSGDGHEDAIVPVDCGAVGANFALSEIYVYTIKDGRAALLAGISDKEMERDYRRHYPDAESYWGIHESGWRVKDGHLEVDVLADGPHSSPKYIVTLEYRLSGETLGLVGKPQRRSAGQ